MSWECCTGCGVQRPKGARWYWVNSNAKPPIVYCLTCADVHAPESVAYRARMMADVRARAAETRRRRRNA